MKYSLLVIAAFLAMPAFGQDYTQSCNANGYVVNASRGVFKGAPVYLGKSCDAFHKDHGKGQWCWHNSGINVNFTSGDWLLSRLELYCENAGLNELDCSCMKLQSGG